MTKQNQINKVIELLVGSCMADLQDVVEELELEDDNEALDLIVEAEIDRCSICDWWCKHEDMEINEYNEFVCFECNEEEE